MILDGSNSKRVSQHAIVTHVASPRSFIRVGITNVTWRPRSAKKASLFTRTEMFLFAAIKERAPTGHANTTALRPK
jgi:hypothetical protein